MGIAQFLKTDPEKSVLFQLNSAKQAADLNLTNSGSNAIMVKLKSTRPGLYKMRPVFGLVPANGSLKVKLIFKGLKQNVKCPANDRFTIVSSLAPSSTTKVDKMWKQHKYREKMVSGEVIKKRIFILFAGVNDHDPLPDSDSEKNVKTGVVKKGKGSIHMEPQATPGSAKPVLVMFRNQEWPDSDDDEDNSGDEDETEKKTPGNQSESVPKELLSRCSEPVSEQPGTVCKTTALAPGFQNNQYVLAGQPADSSTMTTPTTAGITQNNQYSLSQTSAASSTMTTPLAAGITKNNQYPLSQKPAASSTMTTPVAPGITKNNQYPLAQQPAASSTMTTPMAPGITKNNQYPLGGQKPATSSTMTTPVAPGITKNNQYPLKGNAGPTSAAKPASQFATVNGNAPQLRGTGPSSVDPATGKPASQFATSNGNKTGPQSQFFR